MKSLSFPEMFTNSKTLVLSDKEATLSNMKLILQSGIGELFGDPGYGNAIQSSIYQVNNVVLVDLIKDNIYNCLKRYIPQIVCNRDNISVVQNGINLTVTIKAYNYITQSVDVYDIQLITDGDEANQAQ